MADEGTTETTATTAETTATTAVATTTPVSFIDTNGTFTEGWKDHYVPEEYRSDPVFDRAKTIQGAMSMIANYEKMKGADSITMPTEGYSEDDWVAWHKAGGRPEKAEDYGITRPEEMPEELWNADRYTKYSELFHGLGLNRVQVDGIIQAQAVEVLEHTKGLEVDAANAIETLNNGLLTDWGNAYEQKKHLGNVAIEQGVDSPEHKERILEKFGNDPDMIRLLANLGGKFQEAGSIVPKIVIESTPSDITAEINKIMTSPEFLSDNKAVREEASKKLTALYEKKSKVAVPT